MQVARSSFYQSDVLSKTDLVKARDIVLQKWGRIDGLVNAAGGNVPEAVIGPDQDVFDIDVDGLKKAFDLNLFGTILPVTVFGKELQAVGGSIVNISRGPNSAITRGWDILWQAAHNITMRCVEPPPGWDKDG